MSATLLEFARAFTNEKLTADQFADAYMVLWKIERDSTLTLEDPPGLSEFLSRTFIAADAYDPDPDTRLEGEIDEKQLRQEVRELIEKLSL